MTWTRPAPHITGAVLLLLVVAADVATGPKIALAGYFGLVPLVTAARFPPAATAWSAVAAVVAAFVSGLWDDRFMTSQHWAAMVLVLCQSAVAVYVSRSRREREVELREVRAVAEVAQRALLPAIPAKLDGVGFAARYLSAAQAASVGGDLYEVVHTNHVVRVIIGDVKGKGLPAVRLATVVLGAFREAATTWLDPEQVAAACARAVVREADAEDFVTAFLLDIHADGRLTLCSAGHHAPYLISATGARQLTVAEPSPPFGVAERFSSSSAFWEVDDRLLLFTDGLVEARDGTGAFFPVEEHLARLTHEDLGAALDELTAQLSEHVGGNLHDDLAIVLAQRR